MSASRPQPTLHTEEPQLPPSSPGSTRRALIVVGVLAFAFAGFLINRMRTAMDKQKAIAAEQKAVAEQAAFTAGKPPSVTVLRGTPRPWEPLVPLEGTLAPLREADVGFKAPGRLHSIRAKVGDRVRAGQVLATLDAHEAEAQLAAAQAQLAAAEAQAALAVDTDARTSAVVSSGAQSEFAGVQARQQKKLAEAQLAAARAQLELARASRGNHSLVAPFAATVTRAPTGTGAVVAPGVPLFHLADLGTLKLVGSISAADAPLVKVGAAVELRATGAGPVLANGKVVAVVAALDAATKRVPVEVEVANEGPEPLYAGTLMRAIIKGARAITVVSLPPSVLRPGSQNEIFVVSGGKLVARAADFDIEKDGTLLVRNGIGPEDDVLAKAWAEARDGMAVTVATQP